MVANEFRRAAFVVLSRARFHSFRPRAIFYRGFCQLKRIVKPIQDRTRTYLEDPGYLDKILAVGADKARAVSAVTLANAYQHLGFLSPAREV
jgi:hypothetical protein